MGTINRSTKVSGGTTLASNTSALAADVETDMALVYTTINGQLDDDNIKSAANIDPGKLGDYSATAAESKTTATAGTSDSESLATTLEGELERLRYGIEQLATSVDVVRRNGSGATTAAWYDVPARGHNLIKNANFSVKTSSTAGDAPDHWTKVSTPTSLNLEANSTAEGSGNSLNIVADAADEGVSQTLSGLLASTKYLFIVRLKVAAGDTAKVEITGADATSDFRALTSTDMDTTSTSYTTLKGMVQTDSTPTDLVISILSTAASDDINVDSVACYECSAEVIRTPDGTLVVRDTSTSTGTTYVTGSWVAAPAGPITVVVPGEGWGIRVVGHVTGEINVGAGQLDVKLTANIDGAGASDVAGPYCTGFHAVGAQYTVPIYWITGDATPGGSYVLQLEGRTAANSVDSNGTSLASGGALETSMVVELFPTGG